MESFERDTEAEATLFPSLRCFQAFVWVVYTLTRQASTATFEWFLRTMPPPDLADSCRLHIQSFQCICIWAGWRQAVDRSDCAASDYVAWTRRASPSRWRFATRHTRRQFCVPSDRQICAPCGSPTTRLDIADDAAGQATVCHILSIRAGIIGPHKRFHAKMEA